MGQNMAEACCEGPRPGKAWKPMPGRWPGGRPVSKLQNREAEGPQCCGIWPGVTGCGGEGPSAPRFQPRCSQTGMLLEPWRGPGSEDAAGLTSAHVDSGFEVILC